MRQRLILNGLAILLLLITECREPFLPDFQTGKNDYLVVEGYINVGQKAITTITLSRVAPLLSVNQELESEAILSIEDENGIRYQLHEISEGVYSSDSLNLDPTIDYRLLITTSRGGNYASDQVKPKVTPAIDSIHWQWEEGGIQIYVSTHDPGGATKYYKWDFEETWEINSDYKSLFGYSNGIFTYRSTTETESMFKCWQHSLSDNIHFASSNQFEEDQIIYPITNFAHYSDRTSVKYSIVVNQHALTKEEYEFLELIQKNSTATGSLFDPMPSEVHGNIKSVDTSDENVVGYIGAYTTQIERIFITAAQFGIDPPAKCETIEAYTDSEFENYFGPSGAFIPIEKFVSLEDPDYIKYTGASRLCMDCRLRGVPVKPDFWE